MHAPERGQPSGAAPGVPARPGRGRGRLVLALGLAALLLPGGPPARAAQPQEQSVPDSVVLEGNWFQRELTRMRSFPHLDKAYRLLSQGKRGEAVAEFQKYLDLVPRDDRVQELFINLLADEGRSDEALRRADGLLKDQPDLSRLRLVRANLLARLGRDAQAAEDYALVLQAPDAAPEALAQARTGLAAIRLRLGRFDEALALLDASGDQKASPVNVLLRAQALLGLHRAPEASALLGQALEAAREPKDKAGVLAVWAQALTDQGDLEAARERLLESLNILPDQPATLRALAENALRRKDSGQAVEYARQAEALEATPAARELSANALLQAGRPAEAARILGEMASAAKAPEERERLLLRQANALSLAGDDAAASELFAQASRGEKSETALEGLASSLERLGRFKEAADALQKAVDASPTAQRILRLAGLKDKAGLPAEAARLLERALAGELADEARAAAQEELGFLLDKAGKPREALEAWKEALAHRPGDAGLLARMAALSQRMGDIQGAVRYAQAARDAKPDLETSSSLAVLLALTGQTGKAADILRQALPLAGDDAAAQADLLERLGVLEAMTGRHDRAAEAFLKSYAIEPSGRSELLAKAAGELLDAGRDDQARPVLDRLLRLPGLPPAVRAQGQARLGLLALRQDDLALAGQSLGQALDSGALPKAMRLDALSALSAVAQRTGETDKALALLDQALREGMEPWRVRLAMGQALFQAKRYTQALEQLQAARRERPGPRVSLAVARCYEALGKPGLAIHAMREVFPRQAGLSEEEQREYYFALGNLYAETDDNAQAAEAYRKSIAYREDPAVVLRLARMERLNGNPREALRLLRSIQAQAAPGLDTESAPAGTQKAPAPAAAPPAKRETPASAAAARPARAEAPAPAAAAPSARAEAPAPAAQPAAPRQPVPYALAGEGTAPAAREAAAAPPPADAQARQVSVVLVADNATETVLLLKGVGPDVRPALLLLEAPDRLSLDLPGAWSLTGSAPPPAAGGRVLRVRSGRHPDKLRVVLDLAAKPGKPDITHSPEGLVVRLAR